MRLMPDTPGVLYGLQEVLDCPEATLAGSPSLSALHTIARWAPEYLCSANPELGRAGAVCPWCPTSLEFDLFKLKAIRTRDVSAEEIEAQILQMVEELATISMQNPDHTLFRTIVGVLYDLEPQHEVVKLHRKLKPTFLAAGLMLGEFYVDCPNEGLRSRAFYPLKAPLPLLVCRNMVETDIVFLASSVSHIDLYLRQMGRRGRAAASNVLTHSKRFNLKEEEIDNIRTMTSTG